MNSGAPDFSFDAAQAGSKPVSFESLRFDLEAQVLCVPVRHHSPACARHLRSLLLAVRPKAILIEAPRDAEALLPLLQDEATVPPIALYCTWREVKSGLDGHHASYYPLSPESPEWVAIRMGPEIGAQLRFIDLSFAEMKRAELADKDAPSDELGEDAPPSLQQERWMQRSRFLRAAVQRAGLRDSNELWDHWFETQAEEAPEQFFGRVLQWCSAVRTAGLQGLDLDCDSHHRLDSETVAREAHMAACIQSAVLDLSAGGQIVVVTGGYHSPVLLSCKPQRPEPRKADLEEAAVTLMRYGDEQLDALNGYSAGMPSPGFYARLAAGYDVESLLVELARELRERHGRPSVAEAIAAVEQARGLMALRGHDIPAREDIYDAVRSVFVKGSLDIEGVGVLASVRRVLTGTRRGAVPAHAGSPPIVVDFEQSAQRLGLGLSGPKIRELVLDPYRKARDRERSRLMHRLAFLEITFGEFVRGPDFVRGEELGRIQEVWRYRWQPDTESDLIEASRFGASVREAAVQLCLRRFGELERADGRAESAAELLLQAVVCGLHNELPGLVERCETLLQQDADFATVSLACLRFRMAQWACEPLDLHDEPGVAALASAAWERAVYLLPQLRSCAEDVEGKHLEALSAFVDATEEQPRSLLHDALLSLTHVDPEQRSQPNPALAGAAIGLLHGEGVLDDDRLSELVSGWILLGSSEGAVAGRFVVGLLRTGRAGVWQVEALRLALHELLSSCPEPEFLQMLPHLRLAFTDLSPAETHRVASDVALLLEDPQWRAVRSEFSHDEALRIRKIDGQLREELAADGLSSWLADGAGADAAPSAPQPQGNRE
jgi:hypothetical protein